MLSRLTRGSLPALRVPPLLVGLSVLLCMLMTACGKAAPTATPLPRNLPTIIVTLGPGPTLPPTWTPLPTATPRPTATPTSSPTPVPTLTARQICDNFTIESAPSGQQDFDATVTFAWHGVPVDVSVRLTVVQHDTKEGLRFALPIAGDSLFRMPLSRLSAEGDYDWTISLQHPLYGEICTQSGRFTRKPAPFL